MKFLQTITNRRLEIDPVSGIVTPIEKGTPMNMNLMAGTIIQSDKAYLNVQPKGNLVVLPFTHFNLLFRGKEYGIFLTECSNQGLILFALHNLGDRIELLTGIQNKTFTNEKQKILKVNITPGKATKKLVSIGEIEPLF